MDAGSLGFYEWSGRTIKRHRAEIRAHLGFRECTVADVEELTDAPEPDMAITRWTTVALHPDELGWPREALALNSTDDEHDEHEPSSW